MLFGQFFAHETSSIKHFLPVPPTEAELTDEDGVIYGVSNQQPVLETSWALIFWLLFAYMSCQCCPHYVTGNPRDKVNETQQAWHLSFVKLCQVKQTIAVIHHWSREALLCIGILSWSICVLGTKKFAELLIHESPNLSCKQQQQWKRVHVMSQFPVLRRKLARSIAMDRKSCFFSNTSKQISQITHTHFWSGCIYHSVHSPGNQQQHDMVENLKSSCKEWQ